MVWKQLESVVGTLLSFVPVLVVVAGSYGIYLKIIALVTWLVAIAYIVYAIYYGKFSSQLVHEDNDDYVESELRYYLQILEEELGTDAIRVNLMTVEKDFRLEVRKGGSGARLRNRTAVTPLDSTIVRKECVCGDGEKKRWSPATEVVWKIGEGCAGRAAEDGGSWLYVQKEVDDEMNTYQMTVGQFERTKHIAAVVSIPLYEADKLVADGEEPTSPIAMLAVDTTKYDVAEEIKEAFGDEERQEVFHLSSTETERGREAQSHMMSIAAALTKP